MPTVHLLGFRGTGGFKSEKYANEPALIKAGHVGIQLEGEDRVFGFHPTPAAVLQAGGEEPLTELLIAHVAQDGAVQEDTRIFQRAYDLAQQGERTTVWQQTYELSVTEFEQLQAQLLQWYDTQQIFRYNFPKADGNFNPGEYNCALFPKLLGLPVPSENGKLAIYIELMKTGATVWHK